MKRRLIAMILLILAIIKNDGKTTVATRLISNTPAAFLYGALSEDSSAESTSGTTLAGEITVSDLARAEMTATNPSSYIAQWVYTWTVGTGHTYAIRSFGLFNASSGGNMLIQHLWAAAQNLVGGSTFTVTAQIAVSS
jgi:hypothetical protein